MRKTLISLLLCLVPLILAAQGTKDLRINEILVKNVDNYVDDYGHRSSWIEIHNTSHGKVDVGGCYLRIFAQGKETTYRIPTGDPRTVITPLGYCVFFCEGTGTKGTLYTNFTLENVEILSLLNASGKGRPIDEVHIDYHRQVPDVSIGRLTREDGSVIFTSLPTTTPNATNDVEPLMPKHERFRQMDPRGGAMALIAISVVLVVLSVLFLLFRLLGHYMVRLTRKKAASQKTAVKKEVSEVDRVYETPTSGDEIAAIAMALQMFRDELHDKESSVLTINKVARAYSPWSSKIYGLRQYPRK